MRTYGLAGAKAFLPPLPTALFLPGQWEHLPPRPLGSGSKNRRPGFKPAFWSGQFAQAKNLAGSCQFAHLPDSTPGLKASIRNSFGLQILNGGPL